MEKLNIFLKKIMIGPKMKSGSIGESVIQKQKDHIKRIWNDENEITFGINRIFKLILSIYPFFFPTLYIRHLSNKKNYLTRKIVVEIQVLIKLFFPIVLLITNLCEYKFFIFLIVYFVLETIFYLFGLIFLSDTYAPPKSAKRSMLLLILNYMELTFDFAVIYKGLHLVLKPMDYFIVGNASYGTISINNMVSLASTNSHSIDSLSSLEAIYFSFITSTTVGYGEYVPKFGLGQLLVVTQVMIMLLFMVLFVNYFFGILQNTRNSKIKKYKNHSKELKQLLSESKTWDDERRKLLLNYLHYLKSLKN